MTVQGNRTSDMYKGVLERDDWTLIVLYDGADLIGTLTRTCLTLQLYGDVSSSLSYGAIEELFDAETFCKRIEEETCLSLETDQWQQLLDSAVVHDFQWNTKADIATPF